MQFSPSRRLVTIYGSCTNRTNAQGLLEIMGSSTLVYAPDLDALMYDKLRCRCVPSMRVPMYGPDKPEDAFAEQNKICGLNYQAKLNAVGGGHTITQNSLHPPAKLCM